MRRIKGEDRVPDTWEVRSIWMVADRNTQRKISLDRHRRRWEGNDKIDLRGTGYICL